MTNDTRTEALADVEAARATTAEWEAELAEATTEVGAAEAERPRTPQDSASVAHRRLAARERVQVARDALTSARGAETGARHAAVSAEADAMQDAISDARGAVETYRAKVSELLAPLVTLTGSDWAPVANVRSPFTGSTREVRATTPNESTLTAEVERLVQEQTALRAAAAGEEVTLPVAELPRSLQAGGVLPDPRVIADDAERRQQQAEADDWAATVAGWQEQADAAADALGIDAPDVLTTEYDHYWAQANAAEWRERVNGASAIGEVPPAEFDVLAALCGPHGVSGALDQWRAKHATAAASVA